MSNPPGHQFADSITGVFSYLAFVGIIYAGIFTMGALLLGCWEIVGTTPSPAAFCRRLVRLAMFLTVLLMVGDFFSFAWGWTVHGRVYTNPGYSGLDFIPWFPMTQSLVDASNGYDCSHPGMLKLWQLQAIWLCFTTATWSTSLLIFEKIAPQAIHPFRWQGRV